MNMFKREFAKNFRALVIWTAILVGFNAMLAAFFPSIAGQAEKMQEFMELYPKEMMSIFGLDRIDMSTILGFFGTEQYLFITLFGSIYAMLLSCGTLAREESEGTIEFLLSRPVTRESVVAAKGLCILANLLIFNILITLGNFIMFEIVKTEPYSMKTFLLLSVGPLMLHLTFASLGFLASVFIVKAKAIYPVSLGIVIGSYFLNILSTVSKKTQFARHLSFFEYVEAADIIVDGSIRLVYIVVMALLVTASLLLTYVFYARKDITV